MPLCNSLAFALLPPYAMFQHALIPSSRALPGIVAGSLPLATEHSDSNPATVTEPSSTKFLRFFFGSNIFRDEESATKALLLYRKRWQLYYAKHHASLARSSSLQIINMQGRQLTMVMRRAFDLQLFNGQRTSLDIFVGDSVGKQLMKLDGIEKPPRQSSTAMMSGPKATSLLGGKDPKSNGVHIKAKKNVQGDNEEIEWRERSERTTSTIGKDKVEDDDNDRVGLFWGMC